jgi:hypothetical protein
MLGIVPNLCVQDPDVTMNTFQSEPRPSAAAALPLDPLAAAHHRNHLASLRDANIRIIYDPMTKCKVGSSVDELHVMRRTQYRTGQHFQT